MLRSVNQNLWVKNSPSGQADSASPFTAYYQLSEDRYLYFNGLSGAFDLVDAELHGCFTALPARLGLIPPTFRDTLVERGHIVAPGDTTTMKRTLLAQVRAELPLSELKFMICPTDFCSMGCSHCFTYDHTQNAPRAVMDATKIDRAFAYMFEMSRTTGKNLSNVILYGGEPFQPHTEPIVRHVLEKARLHGLPLASFSNGYFLETYRTLLTEYKDNIEILAITLDGLAQLHDSKRKLKNAFDHAVAAIDMLIELGIQVQVKTNVNGQNIGEVPGLISFFKERGWWGRKGMSFELNPIRYGNIKLARDTGTDIDLFLAVKKLSETDPDLLQFDLLPLIDNKYHFLDALHLHDIKVSGIHFPTKVPKIYHCASPSGNVHIFTADGNIFLCNEEIGQSEAIFGRFDAMAEDFRLDEEKIEAYHDRTCDHIQACSACPFLFLCAGGCPSNAKRCQGRDCGTLQKDFEALVGRYSNEILEEFGA